MNAFNLQSPISNLQSPNLPSTPGKPQNNYGAFIAAHPAEARSPVTVRHFLCNTNFLVNAMAISVLPEGEPFPDYLSRLLANTRVYTGA
jgi:hypothetical protein